MAKKYTAQCACGAVKFEFDTNPTFVAVCHCLDCKKASGGEAATFFGVPEDDFTLISGEPNAFHYIAQSGKGLDRNFCPKCGARVFTTNLHRNKRIAIIRSPRRRCTAHGDRLDQLNDGAGIDTSYVASWHKSEVPERIDDVCSWG